MRGESLRNKCGTGQPPVPHRSWVSGLALPPLGAARRRYWWQRSQGVPRYQYWLQKRDSKNHFSATPAASRRRQPAPRADRGGGRNARVTGTHSRAFPNSRWQFTLENCQSATGVTAIISWQVLRLTTYSLHPLCYGMFEAATEKQFPLVQKLWTTKLPCGGLRKTAEES
jgi:hypothetical protein